MCEGEGCTPVETDRLTPIDYSDGSANPSIFLRVWNGKLRLSKEIRVESGGITWETRDDDFIESPKDLCAKLIVYHGLIPWRKETREFVISGERLAAVITSSLSERD